tara:strand:+ start:274 stop:570 length:297 start_codon:yes stop_codon:yes gene_type:complete
MPGKPWKIKNYHNSYESALEEKDKLTSIWSNNSGHEGMQVKIRYYSSKNYWVVKTRLHPDFEPAKPAKEDKKNAKRKGNRKNKRNNEGRKYDPQASIE